MCVCVCGGGGGGGGGAQTPVHILQECENMRLRTTSKIIIKNK